MTNFYTVAGNRTRDLLRHGILLHMQMSEVKVAFVYCDR